MAMLVGVSTYLKKNTKMRNAARMFYFLKQHASSKFRLSEVETLEDYFSQYQIDTYLKLLIAEGWIGKDNAGYLYLRGATFFKQKFGGNKKRDPDVKVPAHAVLSAASWRSLIDGSLVGFVALGFERAIKKEQSKSEASLIGGVKDPITISCSMLEERFGISTAQASRMRSNGAKSGLIENKENLEPKGLFLNPSQMAAFRETRKEVEASLSTKIYYRLIDGEVHIQKPNIINVDRSQFRFKKP